MILRALQLGDLLCAVPAVRALRYAFPQAHIALVGLPWAMTFVRRFGAYLDEFIEFPGYPGLPERPADLASFPRFIAAMQHRGWDLALQMHGSGAFVNSLTALWRARLCAGFYRSGEYCPDPERFLLYPDEEPEVWRHLRLVEYLGLPLHGDHLEFPLTPEDERDLPPWARRFEAKGYACIHPGARFPSRRWPTDRFAAVGDALAERGLQVVLTGSSTEVELTGAVAGTMRAPCVDLAGQTTLGALALVLRHARVLVCNDTGVSHLAAALQLRSVVISSGADPRRWAPLNRGLHRVLSHEVECRPCDHVVCPIGHPCALGVSVEPVLTQIDELLRQPEETFFPSPAPCAS